MAKLRVGHDPHDGCVIHLTDDMIKRYIRDLKTEYDTHNASEYSYRPSLKTLIETVSNGKIIAQVETKDQTDIKLFLKLRSNRLLPKPFGTIETKTIHDSSQPNSLLDMIKIHNVQLQKYLQHKHSIIFTNYLEFCLLWINPITKKIELGDVIQLITLKEFKNNIILPNPKNCTKLEKLFQKFIHENSASKPIVTQKMLACHLAQTARELANEMVEEVTQIKEKIRHNDIDNLADPIYIFYKQYTHLTRSETPQDVANAFGQTIACGLFLAKLSLDSNQTNAPLTQNIASANIPRAVPVIQELFQNIERYEPSQNLSRYITQIIDTLNQTDIDKVRNESSDIFVYFYEEFLKAFDRTNRAQMGVYYTPVEVVNYICTKIHSILKDDFGKSFGFGDVDIRILDPATGTGTFLVQAIDLAIKENSTNDGGGGGGGGVHTRKMNI